MYEKNTIEINEASKDVNQFLVNTTITRSEFNSKYKSKMISIYKDTISKVKSISEDIDVAPDEYVKGEIKNLDEKTNYDAFSKSMKICVVPKSIKYISLNNKVEKELISCIPKNLLNKKQGGSPDSNFELYITPMHNSSDKVVYILRTCIMRGDHIKASIKESTNGNGGNKMSSILNDSVLNQPLLEGNNNDMSEFDLQYFINELASILISAKPIENKLVYTAESVPVFAMEKDGKNVFVIEQENLNKLMKSQCIDVSTALHHIKESIEEELSDQIDCIDMSDLAVTFNKEDIEKLQTLCTENATKITSRCNAISSYNKFLNKIISEGVQLLFKEN